ncbi:MAG TPA: 23S rRNA (uracil(1939)-C(5))-methyltransferase RlmD [Candidatus Syntrophosphaera sp.]|nr:23S rRNA (uracil(1939)-C(5))-methyltransferase RlmD [Candidatus Syntrophosphaera sp.]
MKQHFPLRIEKLTLGGCGLGHAEGKAVFVPYTAPGDEIAAELVRERKDVAFARARSWAERGPGVINPPCPVFAADPACGGCDWLHLDYGHQLSAKTSLIRELLQPLAPQLEIPATLASPEIRHYRNKALLPVAQVDGRLACGIYARWSHRLVEHQDCQLHPPLFDRIARRCLELMQKAGVQAYDEAAHQGSLRHLGFRCNRDQSQILLIIVTRGAKLPFTRLLVNALTSEFPQLAGIVQNINRQRGNVILGPEEKLLWGEPWLEDELAGLRFRAHYRSFWQVNIPLLERILDLLREQLSPQDVLYDVFSGTGSLGLALSGSVRQVLCIEENSAAVADGEFNVQANGIANASFLCARTEDALPALLAAANRQGMEAPTAILLDPPRGGVHPSALQAIINAAPARVLYLSCSPNTLRRDLQFLLADGRYALHTIQPCDMFPHTWHVEVLAVLELAQTVLGG